MAQNVLLNDVAHRDLRVRSHYAAEFGDNVATAMIVPTEFGELQRDYPIFFRKEPGSDAFTAIVLLGLQKDENLYLDEKGWNASYVPAVVARGPFFIGLQEQQVEGKVRPVPVVLVDLDHPRVSKSEGEALFKPDGSNTPYLERMANILNAIGKGMDIAKPMYEAFQAAGLIEPVKLEVKVNAEEQFNLTGLHTINREKLATLDADTLFGLHRAGYLQAAFLVVSSLNNIQRLIDMKNRRRAPQAAMAS
jgi:SapC